MSHPRCDGLSKKVSRFVVVLHQHFLVAEHKQHYWPRLTCASN